MSTLIFLDLIFRADAEDFRIFESNMRQWGFGLYNVDVERLSILFSNQKLIHMELGFISSMLEDFRLISKSTLIHKELGFITLMSEDFRLISKSNVGT